MVEYLSTLASQEPQKIDIIHIFGDGYCGIAENAGDVGQELNSFWHKGQRNLSIMGGDRLRRESGGCQGRSFMLLF
jgi:hypothetical protein